MQNDKYSSPASGAALAAAVVSGVALLAGGVPAAEAASIGRDFHTATDMFVLGPAGTALDTELSAARSLGPDASSPTVQSLSHTFTGVRATGTSYADATGQFGNSASIGFGRPGGAAVATFYSATFQKQAADDVIKTRISNTNLSLSDSGSSFMNPLVANLGLRISTIAGELGDLDVNGDNGTNNPDLETKFLHSMEIRGRRGDHGGTLANPDAGPFTLIGNRAVFPGEYFENESPNGPTSVGARYELDATTIEVPLDDFEVGEIFSVLWTAQSSVISPGGETFADAQFWDPINGPAFYEIGPSELAAVPVPGALILFGSALGLLGLRRRAR